MNSTLERRVGAVERRMGVDAGPLAHFSDADLIAAVEWMSAMLAEAGDASAETLAREDFEEARLKAFYTRPDVAGSCSLQLEQGVRWPYQRARALWWEQNYPGRGPRSAGSAEELVRKIEAAMAKMRRPP